MGDGVFGDGKWRLLCEIKRGKSIRAAALALGMSYRKAWGDLNRAEECLKVKLIERRRGGAQGGDSKLTREGDKWLEAYQAFRKDIEDQIRRSYNKRLKNL